MEPRLKLVSNSELISLFHSCALYPPYAGWRNKQCHITVSVPLIT